MDVFFASLFGIYVIGWFVMGMILRTRHQGVTGTKLARAVGTDVAAGFFVARIMVKALAWPMYVARWISHRGDGARSAAAEIDTGRRDSAD